MKLNDEERQIMVSLEYEKALSFLGQAEKNYRQIWCTSLLQVINEGGSKVRLVLSLFVLLMESCSKYSILKEENFLSGHPLSLSVHTIKNPDFCNLY